MVAEFKMATELAQLMQYQTVDHEAIRTALLILASGVHGKDPVKIAQDIIKLSVVAAVRGTNIAAVAYKPNASTHGAREVAKLLIQRYRLVSPAIVSKVWTPPPSIQCRKALPNKLTVGRVTAAFPLHLAVGVFFAFGGDAQGRVALMNHSVFYPVA